MDNQSFVFNTLYYMHCILCIVFYAFIKLLKGWGPTTLLRCTPLVQVNQASISLVVLDKERSWVSTTWTIRALYSMHCILWIILYALYSMHCILCIIYKNVWCNTNQKYLRSSSLYINIWGRLPFKNIFEVAVGD